MKELDICYLSAAEMAQAIKTRKLSPVEIMKAVLHRIEQLNPRVNAYCTIVADRALAQARAAEARVMRGDKLGPLHGIPVSIKDLIFTEGIRTTGGSRIYADFIPRQDAIAVESLKAAGAIVIGKTNTAEFGWVAITDNPLFGETRNPWNLALTPGGSSGGAAASVASGMGPLAIGSFGRVPQSPDFPGWETLGHTGPITRTVEDAALTMGVIAGRDNRDPTSLPDTAPSYLPFSGTDLKGLKVAWSPDLGYAPIDPQVLRITEAAVKTFAALGANVDTATPEASSPGDAFITIVSARIAAVWQDRMAEVAEQMTPALARFIQRNSDKSAAEYIKATLRQSKYGQEIQPFFARYDLLLTPTVTIPPFELGSYGPKEIAGRQVSTLEWMDFTYPFNMTGQPAASVPCGWTDDGLPIGLQIIGRRFEDATVLKAACAFEQAAPWADRRPPLTKEV